MLFTGDLSQNAQFEMTNISTDKRALRESLNFFISDITFESAYEFRVYSLNDVLQIKIKDSQETYATLRLAEMPLCEGHDEDGVSCYVQVG